MLHLGVLGTQRLEERLLPARPRQLDRVLGRQGHVRDRKDLAIELERRRKLRGQKEVGAPLGDHQLEDVLQEFREEIPHSLDQVDITDEAHAEWHAKYKYDIPVLHLNGQYWLKHRTTNDEVRAGLLEALAGRLEARTGEPNAEAMERN